MIDHSGPGLRRWMRPVVAAGGRAGTCASPGLAAAGPAAAGATSCRVRPGRVEVLLAVAAFAVLCVVVLSVTPRLVEPDDYAYRASIIANTQGHFLTLSAGQVRALAGQLDRCPPPATACAFGPGIEQWVRLPGGRWISEKNPGYPFLAAPFQALGLIRLAPLFYGALACLGLFAAARRWLGRYGGTAAVGLFCSSGAAMLFAWRDYMPTFTDASLIAAGTGALLWAVLAADAPPWRRTWIGLAGFLAIEAAVFVRYIDIVVLGCAVAAVALAGLKRPGQVPRAAPPLWIGSAAVFCAAVAVFDDLVYGGPLRSGYRPGEVSFSLAAVPPNLRLMPAHLIQAMPMAVPALAALAWIAGRRARLAQTGASRHGAERRDFAVGLALAAAWLSIWGLYTAYTWTAQPGLSTLQAARFYVPAAGPIALLGAWLVVRVPAPARSPRRQSLAAAATAVTLAMFGLGAWSFSGMVNPPRPGPPPPQCNIGEPHCQAPGQPRGQGGARAPR